jgi:uroporphyrin-3 C-methyltransferase
VWRDVRGLVRVSRIDQPEASLLAPDQSYFVRENLKLRILNARLGLLARHFEVVRSDLNGVIRDLTQYFDTQSRQGQSTLLLAREVLVLAKQTELPRVDDTLAALTTAAAGR